MMSVTYYSTFNNLHSVITTAQPSGSRDCTFILTVTALQPSTRQVDVPVLLNNSFGIRTWQIWECIWNWDSPRPVPIGGHHKSATSSLARPCVPAGLPTVPLRQDVLGPRYFSDPILPCSLTPLMRFGLLNCPAVWLSTLGLRAPLWYPSGCNVRIVDSVEPRLNDVLWLTSQ